MPIDPETDDLAWSAFLYVADEMSPAEASAFEDRLLDDQGAREAVAAAVELAGALTVVAREPAIVRLPRRWRASRIAGLALAAGVAGLAASLFWSTGGPATGDAAEVALRWSDLRGGHDGEWAAFVADGPAPAAHASDDPVVEVEVEAGLPDDPAVPSWLTAAVAAPEPDGPLEEE